MKDFLNSGFMWLIYLAIILIVGFYVAPVFTSILFTIVVALVVFGMIKGIF